jgi:hypothetical protein
VPIAIPQRRRPELDRVGAVQIGILGQSSEPECRRAIDHGADDQLGPSAFVALREAHA